MSIAELQQAGALTPTATVDFLFRDNVKSTNLGQIFHVRVFSRIVACKRDADGGVPLAPQILVTNSKPKTTRKRNLLLANTVTHVRELNHTLQAHNSIQGMYPLLSCTSG